MKTPERTVEEIVGEHVGKIITACFHNDGTKKSVTDVIDKEVPLLIKRIKQAERQKREEMVEAEKKKIISLIDGGHHDPTTDSGWSVSLEDVKEALTQPNNPK